MENVVNFKSEIKVTDIFLHDQKSSQSSSAMVKLICQNGQINVHKDILGARSPFLLELFKEQDCHITLADFDVRLVEKFCRLVYQGFTIVQDKEDDDVENIATILGCGKLKKSPATPQEIKASSSVKISVNDNEDGTSGSNISGRDESRGRPPSRARPDRNDHRSRPEDGKSDSNSNNNNCTLKKKKKGHRYEEESQNEHQVSSAEPSEDEEETTESEDGHDGFSGGRETRSYPIPEPRNAKRSTTQEQNETGPSRRARRTTLSARDVLRIRQEAALKQQPENAKESQFGGHHSELPIGQNQEETVANDVQASQSSSIEKEQRKESRVGPATKTWRPRILRSSHLELSDENHVNSTPGTINSISHTPATNLEVQTETNNKDMQNTNNRPISVSAADLKDLTKKLFYCNTCYKQCKDFPELSQCLWRHGFQKCLSCLQPVLIPGSYKAGTTFDDFGYFNAAFNRHCELQGHYGPLQDGTAGLCCPYKGCHMYLPQELLWHHVAKEHIAQLDPTTNSSYGDHFEEYPEEYSFLYREEARASTSAPLNVPNSVFNNRQQRTTAKRTQPIDNSGPGPSTLLSKPILSPENWIEMIIQTMNFFTEQRQFEPKLECVYQRVLYEQNIKLTKSARAPNLQIVNADITKEQVELQLESMIKKGFLTKSNTDDGSLIYTLAEFCKTYPDYLEYMRQKVEEEKSEPNSVKRTQPFSASTTSETINTNSNVANVAISSNSQNSTTSSTVTLVTDSNKDKTVTVTEESTNNNSITSTSSTLLSTPATTQQQSNSACLKKIEDSIEKRQHASKRLRMQPAPLSDSRSHASATASTATTTTSTLATAIINTNVTDTNATVINVTDTNHSTLANATATSSINSAAAPRTFLAPAHPATQAKNEQRSRANAKVNKKIAVIVSTAAKRTCSREKSKRKEIQPESSSDPNNKNSTPDQRSTRPPQANAIETSSSSQQKPTDSIETNKTKTDVQVATLVQPIELPSAGPSVNQQTSSHQKPTESSESDAPPPKKKLRRKKVQKPEPEPYLPVSTMQETMKRIETRNPDGTISEIYHCEVCKANIEEKELAEDHDVYCLVAPASPTPSLVSLAGN